MGNERESNDFDSLYALAFAEQLYEEYLLTKDNNNDKERADTGTDRISD